MRLHIAPPWDADQSWLESRQAPLILFEGNICLMKHTGPIEKGNMNMRRDGMEGSLR